MLPEGAFAIAPAASAPAASAPAAIAAIHRILITFLLPVDLVRCQSPDEALTLR
jgi:hypothetical protein